MIVIPIAFTSKIENFPNQINNFSRRFGLESFQIDLKMSNIHRFQYFYIYYLLVNIPTYILIFQCRIGFIVRKQGAVYYITAVS